MENLIPRVVVQELDRYIIGQAEAKKAVAVALRNRYRRRQLPEDLRREIAPKNILMIGPTGVGKTEIARRVAKLLDAPFVKVEATKFTEVGYVGRDVESIIYDLVETSVEMVHERKMQEVKVKAENLATERIISYLCEQSVLPGQRVTAKAQAQSSKAMAGAGGAITVSGEPYSSGQVEAYPRERTAEPTCPVAVSDRRSGQRPVSSDKRHFMRERKRVAELLQRKELEDAIIEIETNAEFDTFNSVLEFSGAMTVEEMTDAFQEFMQSQSALSQKRQRRVSVKEARRILTREEANKLINLDALVEEALQRVEETGVVFIDELDKIVGPRVEAGADVSGEGVQRDLLPILDGTLVQTRYGQVRTDHILFLAAGSFHNNKPADLIPELQGRFPLRIELQSLTERDLERILIEPENALTKQYQSLLSTEGVELVFAPDGIRELAHVTASMNERMENIGARRLQTVMERVLEDISFNAPEYKGEKIIIDASYVQERLHGILEDEDLSRYIL
ncbi:MAG: ATP-dependent protease ATPase subunit HslU [Chloroflexi bacterium]|nr:ATP-dependent protease ATPase subunit HslU [Chloroflexota bacterium]